MNPAVWRSAAEPICRTLAVLGVGPRTAHGSPGPFGWGRPGGLSPLVYITQCKGEALEAGAAGSGSGNGRNITGTRPMGGW